MLHTASGEPVSPQRALEAARGWLALTDAKPMEKALGSGILSLMPGTDAHGRTLYFAVYLEKGGFLALAPDDQLEPVLAFSAEAADLNDTSPCNHLRLMLASDLAALLEDVKTRTDATTKAKTSKWLLLEAAARNPQSVKAGLGSVSDMRVAPLIQTRWGQNYVSQGRSKLACFNYYTPPFGDGNAKNYPCGCVATTYAQLMRFYKCPKQGVGTTSLPVIVDEQDYNRRLRGGNGAGGKYDWSNMPTDPTALAKAGKLTEVQRKAIGALCHDAGVASRMHYRADGSTAWFTGDSLRNTFHFGTDNHYVDFSSSIPRDELNRVLNSNLDAGMPCGISVIGDGYHALLVDSYGYAFGSLYHHLNMGWNGYGDAWYLLPAVSSYISFTRVDSYLVNIWPWGNVYAVSGQVKTRSGKPLAGVPLVADIDPVYAPYAPTNRVTALTDSNGRYALKLPYATWTITPQVLGKSFQPSSNTVTYCQWKTDFTRGTNSPPPPD